MTIERLNDAVAAAKAEVKTALEIILSALNQGQRKKLAGSPAVGELLERYGVEMEACRINFSTPNNNP